MKYLKMLGLAAVAAMAVMAFVGASSASADQLCTKTESPCATANLITSIDATLAAGTTSKLSTTEGTVLDTCTSGTVGGTVEKQGVGVDPISGPISSLTWGSSGTNCTFTTTTIKNGKLDVTSVSTPVAHSGTVTGTENEVTVNTGLFGSCVFTTGAGTDLGTIQGGSNKLVINTVVNKVSGLCPSTERWEATYTITNHSAVYVMNN